MLIMEHTVHHKLFMFWLKACTQLPEANHIIRLYISPDGPIAQQVTVHALAEGMHTTARYKYFLNTSALHVNDLF